MLRLSTKPHPHNQHDLDELFLHVYVLVDDWLKANEMRFNLPQQRTQVVSYSKLFTVVSASLSRSPMSQFGIGLWVKVTRVCFLGCLNIAVITR